jgi:hypothetical protein
MLRQSLYSHAANWQRGTIGEKKKPALATTASLSSGPRERGVTDRSMMKQVVRKMRAATRDAKAAGDGEKSGAGGKRGRGNTNVSAAAALLSPLGAITEGKESRTASAADVNSGSGVGVDSGASMQKVLEVQDIVDNIDLRDVKDTKATQAFDALSNHLTDACFSSEMIKCVFCDSVVPVLDARSHALACTANRAKVAPAGGDDDDDDDDDDDSIYSESSESNASSYDSDLVEDEAYDGEERASLLAVDACIDTTAAVLGDAVAKRASLQSAQRSFKAPARGSLRKSSLKANNAMQRVGLQRRPSLPGGGGDNDDDDDASGVAYAQLDV